MPQQAMATLDPAEAVRAPELTQPATGGADEWELDSACLDPEM